MYKELKKYIVNFASDDSRRTTVTIQSNETTNNFNQTKATQEKTIRRSNNLEA
jgi:hypothetical protein